MRNFNYRQREKFKRGDGVPWETSWRNELIVSTNCRAPWKVARRASPSQSEALTMSVLWTAALSAAPGSPRRSLCQSFLWGGIKRKRSKKKQRSKWIRNSFEKKKKQPQPAPCRPTVWCVVHGPRDASLKPPIHLLALAVAPVWLASVLAFYISLLVYFIVRAIGKPIDSSQGPFEESSPGD